MRKLVRRSIWLGFVIEIACCYHLSSAGQLQSVSLSDPGQSPPVGGSGDSLGPIISQDGRYVLFASTANNLVLNVSNTPLPVLIPPKLNVFLRDRTNQTTTLVSVNLAGTGGGNGDSIPVAISTNGQYVLFESTAGDLVPGDSNGFNDVFLRDLVHGATALVSVSTNGGAANGLSRNSVMTPDGRYVAFTSEASNLVAFDTNGIADVFVRDMQGGATTLASAGAMNAPSVASNSSLTISSSDWPQITPDGRYVAFSSTATNLAPGVTNGGQIYVRDLVGGATIWASSAAQAAVTNVAGVTNGLAVCFNHAISDDGQFVAYEARPVNSITFGQTYISAAVVLRYNLLSGFTDIVHTNSYPPTQLYLNTGNLSMTPDGQSIAFVANTNVAVSTNNLTCVQVWSALTGSNVLASVNLSNSVSVSGIFAWPVIDSTGRYVTFQSSAADLTTNSLLGTYHLFLRDLQAGTTTMVDADANGVGTGVGPDAEPSLSTNGPSVAFEAPDGNLVPNDRNRALDVFVRNIGIGTNEMVSACPPAASSLTPNGLSGMTLMSVSANGRYVAFTSDADNLVPNDTNGWRDVFLRDLVLGTNILVSASTNGGVGNDESFGASISGDGRYVAFTSSASNLVANDFNNLQDVFVRDTQLGTTVLASVNTNGVSGNGDSYSAMIASNGTYVLFQSTATDIAPAQYNMQGLLNLFFRDLQLNKTYALTSNGIAGVSTTPNGRYVLFFQSLGDNFNLWDTQAKALVYSGGFSIGPAASVDGNIIVLNQGNSFVVFNRASNTAVGLFSGAIYSRTSLNISSDGRWLAYATTAPLVITDNNSVSDVYLYDIVARTNYLVSHNYNSTGAGNAASDYPTMSGDGRFIAYRSAATDLIPGDSSSAPQIYLFDHTNASTTLLSLSGTVNQPANNRSSLPVFSGDGHTLVFQSWSSDLVAQDENLNSDLFAYTLITNGVGQPFFVQIVGATVSGGKPTISWTAVPGVSYRVQWSLQLTDPFWFDARGGVFIVGNTAYFIDPLLNFTGQRFYRVIAF